MELFSIRIQRTFQLVSTHIGASLKDLGKKMFAFSKLELPAHTIIDVL